jgi:hypothetical protein
MKQSIHESYQEINNMNTIQYSSSNSKNKFSLYRTISEINKLKGKNKKRKTDQPDRESDLFIFIFLKKKRTEMILCQIWLLRTLQG